MRGAVVAPPLEPASQPAGRRTDWRRLLALIALLFATVAFTLGVFSPIIQLRKLIFWTETHSLVSTVQSLWRDRQTFLAVMIVVFSILLPFLKLTYLLLISAVPDDELQRFGRAMSRLEWLGRLSMHDVLVLALSIFFMKTSGLYDATSLSGVHLYTTAVALMILASGLMHGKLNRLVETTRGRGADRDRQVARRAWKAMAWRVFLSLLVIFAAVTLALGIFLPAIRFTTAYVWAREHSIFSIISALWRSEEMFLGSVVLCVSVAFPVFKLWYLLLLVLQPAHLLGKPRVGLAILEWLGRYSMTDVMVVALMIFYVNSSGYVEAQVLAGLYWFAASAFLTISAYALAGAARRHVTV